MPAHFSTHLRDAIRINRERQPYYASQTGGRSRWLSRWLVLSEYLCLPLAHYFDRKAAPFNARGIGIVADDFIDMVHILPAETPPPLQGVAGPTTRARVKSALGTYRKEGLQALSAGDYQTICASTAATLAWLSVEERQCGASFAMSRHLLESIGFAALHADAYLKADPATATLARQLTGVQLRLADAGVLSDRLAQQCHRLGAGIIINDVPTIPFLEGWHEAGENAR
jgi:hypothetical protein